MDPYRRMAILVAVVESGSLRRAARELGLTPSAVSQQVRRLEQEAGASLLRRSTRRLALTQAGEAFYEGCAAMVAAARGAHERLAGLIDSPRGELSVSAPAGFAATHLVPALAAVLGEHPALNVRLLVTDEKVDLIQDRIDVAITIGRPLPSSSLVRHHLADWALGIVASPSYLSRRGMTADPSALAPHDFLTLPRWHHGGEVLVSPGGQRHNLTVAPRVISNNQLSIKQLTLAGRGLSFQALPEVAPELAAGHLVRVLPAWILTTLSVDALTPARARPPAAVRVFVQALKDHLARAGSGLERTSRRRGR